MAEKRSEFTPLSDRTLEEEYFFEHDLELARKLRAKLDREREARFVAQRREAHWMRCPKCGATLQEKEQDKVRVDVCPNCGGLFLDKGELELILRMHEKETFLDRLSRAVDGFFTQGFNIKREDR